MAILMEEFSLCAFPRSVSGKLTSRGRLCRADGISVDRYFFALCQREKIKNMQRRAIVNTRARARAFTWSSLGNNNNNLLIHPSTATRVFARACRYINYNMTRPREDRNSRRKWPRDRVASAALAPLLPASANNAWSFSRAPPSESLTSIYFLL